MPSPGADQKRRAGARAHLGAEDAGSLVGAGSGDRSDGAGQGEVVSACRKGRRDGATGAAIGRGARLAGRGCPGARWSRHGRQRALAAARPRC